MMRRSPIRRSLLFSCLGVSLALHVGVLWYFFASPFYLADSQPLAKMRPNPMPVVIPKEDDELIVEKIERALEESLNEVIAITHKAELGRCLANSAAAEKATDMQPDEVATFPQVFTPTPKVSAAEFELMRYEETEYCTTMPPLFDPEMEASLSDFAMESEADQEIPAYESEMETSISLPVAKMEKACPEIDQLISDDYSMTAEQFSPSAMPLHLSQELTPHLVSSLETLSTPAVALPHDLSEEQAFTRFSESTHPKLILPNSVDYLRKKWINRSLAERRLPDLDHYGLDEIACSLEWEESLDVDVSLMPTPDGSKYIFSLAFHPDFDMEQGAMRQNFYFLIDRSSSIGKQKFNRFKRAVSRAMAALREGDSFNIIVFDKKVSRLSDRPIAVSPRSIQKAASFLEGHQAKTHFAAADVYTSLDKLLPNNVDPNEMHSVILITDGGTLLKPSKQRAALAQWSRAYNGHVNFYTAASGKGNNLVLLDLLSYSTGGRLLYSDTNAAFPRKLVRLVKDLHYPLVKNVTIEIEARDKGANVQLHPQGQLLPPMFAGQTYKVVGTIDELSDLTLYVQGRNRNQYLNIHKEINISDVGRGGRSLEKAWANCQAKACYEHYLENGKRTHLKEAVQIVTPYKGVISMGE